MSTMGDKSLCDQCDEEIEFIGPYWRHTKGEPRHVALPQREVCAQRCKTCRDLLAYVPRGEIDNLWQCARCSEIIGRATNVLACMTIAEGIVEHGDEPIVPHSMLPACQAEIVREEIPSWFQPMPLVAMHNPDGVVKLTAG